jgi:DNA-directed RNA polymerase alpha subunit
MNRLSEGSIVFIDSEEAFIVMKRMIGGYTIASVSESGIEMKDAVTFESLQEMENWFESCESKIVQIIPFEECLHNLHRMAIQKVADMNDPTLESLEFSIRTYNVLKRAGINYQSEIKGLSYEKITSFRNMGRKSLTEIEHKLNVKFEPKLKTEIVQ